MKNFTRLFRTVVLAAAIFVSGRAAAVPAYDFIDAAWIDGIPRYIYGSFTTPPAEEGYVDLFIIGPILPNHPQDEVTLEPFYPYHHDHVSDKTPYDDRKLVRFFIVRPGPNATPYNVLTREVEIQDIGEEPVPPPGFEFTPVLEAPWAIKLGPTYKTLRKAETIREGIEAGLLTTVEVVVGVDITGWSGLPAFNTDF